jgi:polar amino acid transport system substrate-binding protein
MKKIWLFSLLLVLLLHYSCSNKNPGITTLSGLEGGKTIAVPTGTVADKMALQRFPDAKIEYYNNVYDCALAVLSGKADGTVYDKPVLQNLVAKTSGGVVLDELLMPDYYGFAIRKEDTGLKAVIDSVLQEIRTNGVYEDMSARWFPAQGAPGPMPDIESDGSGGIVRFGTAAITEPMAFVDQDQKIIGFDIEFASRIAQKLNKKLEVVNMEFGALLPALISGKVDMIGAGLSITEERAKKVLFSEPYYNSGIAAFVKKPDATGALAKEERSKAGSLSSKQKLGVLMGSIYDAYAHKNYPGATIYPFNTLPDMLLALQSGKIDATFVDQTSIKEILSKNPDFTVLEEALFTTDIAAGFSKKNADLRSQFNQFLKEIRSDGTYDAMIDRWMNHLDADMPKIPVTGLNGILNIGIVSDLGLPFELKVNDTWKGFDVELSSRFAASLGKNAVFVDMPFGSLLPALVSGKIDIITASMMITEERAKQIDFSDPYFNAGASMIGYKKEAQSPTRPGMLSVLDDIADKRIGIFTGTVHDAFVAGQYPKAQVFRFESTADMMASLKNDKVDVTMLDLITAGLVLKQNPDLGLLSDKVYDMPLGVGFNKKNTELLKEFNDFLKEIRQDGTYQQMTERWFVKDADEAVMPEFKGISSDKKLVVGVSVEDLPYVAVINDQYVGFDIEMIRRFAERRNYEVKFVNIGFPALVTALASGKVDMISDGICISPERAEQINFSDEYAMFRTGVIALRSKLAKFEGQEVEAHRESFWTKLGNSFYNNIIRENRYLMILRGLVVTIIISIFALLVGTIFGGLVCMMRMSKNKMLRSFASFYISLIRGTPVLVLLMIIYYVVFASVNINAVFVAVVAFGINFAAYVSEMFRTSIESIDKGQTEAGIASGFTRVQTFIYIIMPQALRRVLPVYKGEFISLVKMTSVVGYIAVEDLTKASDIIRSRTFDAFFPLIMAAVIYILIAWLLTLALDYVEINVDPKRRRLSFRKVVTK